MIKHSNRIDVTIECDACALTFECAAGEKADQLQTLSDELRRKPGWKSINDRDVCPKCAAMIEKVYPSTEKERRK